MRTYWAAAALAALAATFAATADAALPDSSVLVQTPGQLQFHPYIHSEYGHHSVWLEPYGYNFHTASDPTTYFTGTVVHRMNPSTGQVQKILETNTIRGGTPVAIGDSIYIIGTSTYPGEIVRYDPPNTMSVVALLVEPTRAPMVVTDGEVAYIMGGFYASGWSRDAIQRFNPNTNEVSVIGQLPYSVKWASAVWADGAAYVFGGVSEDPILAPPPLSTHVGDQNEVHDRIIRVLPDGTATVLTTRLPTELALTTAVWDGERAFLFGGQMESLVYHPLTSLDRPVLAFEPNSGILAALPAVVSNRWSAGSFFDGCHAFVVSGFRRGASNEFQNDSTVLKYGPSASDPPCLRAVEFSASSPDCRTTFIDFGSHFQPATAMVSWHWDFGDGDSSTQAAVRHEYERGSYVVTLSGTDSYGNTKTTSRVVDVFPVESCPPTIDPVPAATVPVGTLVHLCTKGHSGMGGELTYSAAALPTDASFNPACMPWTPQHAGHLGCVMVRVTESPGGLWAETCMTVTATKPPEYERGELVSDGDMDGVSDAADNCPIHANPGQTDADRDGVGDACSPEPCGRGKAFLREGVLVTCPEGMLIPAGDPTVARLDRDLDGAPDAWDLCPGVPDDQADLDGDGAGDACDADMDGDGIRNDDDECPRIPDRRGCTLTAAPGIQAATATPSLAAPLPAHTVATWMAMALVLVAPIGVAATRLRR